MFLIVQVSKKRWRIAKAEEQCGDVPVFVAQFISGTHKSFALATAACRRWQESEELSLTQKVNRIDCPTCGHYAHRKNACKGGMGDCCDCQYGVDPERVAEEAEHLIQTDPKYKEILEDREAAQRHTK